MGVVFLVVKMVWGYTNCDVGGLLNHRSIFLFTNQLVLVVDLYLLWLWILNWLFTTLSRTSFRYSIEGKLGKLDMLFLRERQLFYYLGLNLLLNTDNIIFLYFYIFIFLNLAGPIADFLFLLYILYLVS